MSKRFLTLVCIAFFIFFNACSGVIGNDKASLSETTVFDVDESLIEDFVKLTFILVGGTKNFMNQDYFDDEKIAPPLDLINEKLLVELNTQIEFQWIYQGENHSYQNAIYELYQSGIPFDVFAYHDITPFIENGIAKDITDHMKSLRYIKMFFDENELENSPYIAQDKRIYAIPAIYDQRNLVPFMSDMLTPVLIPQSDERYFSTHPMSVRDDLLHYVSCINEKETEATGFSGHIRAYLQAFLPETTYLHHTYGAIFSLDQDMNVTWLCDTPYLSDLIHEYYDCFRLGESPVSPSGYAEISYSAEIFDPLYRKPNDANKLFDKGFDFTFVTIDCGHTPIKRFPGYSGQNYETGINGDMVIYGKAVDDLMIIPDTCKNPERVMLFLDWLYSDSEHYNLFRYGQENVNYYKDEKGRIYVDLSNNILYKWKGFSFFVNPYMDNFNIPGHTLDDILKKRQYTSIQKQVLSNEKPFTRPLEEELLDFQNIMLQYLTEYNKLLEDIDRTRNIDEALRVYQGKFSDKDREFIEDFVKRYSFFYTEHYAVSFKDNHEG
ncbi:MAG: hypothetical protein PHG06_17690 [Parabacteroides sp.]|nr:hypothetical protein [Parabacteroides sp.]